MDRRRQYRLPLVCVAAAAACLWTPAAIHGQTGATPTRLSPELQAHLKSERFQAVTSVRGLPLGVRDAMRALWGTPVLDIVDPDGSQPTDGGPTKSSRRLLAAGCSNDHCLVSYELGGRTRSSRVVLFHWTPSATKLEWGGTPAGALTKLDDVLNVAQSGRVEGPPTSW